MSREECRVAREAETRNHIRLHGVRFQVSDTEWNSGMMQLMSLYFITPTPQCSNLSRGGVFDQKLPIDIDALSDRPAGHLGLDADRARAAEAQVKEWRERHELWLPRFPRQKITEIDSTLEYPAGGSYTGAGRR